MGFVTFEIAPGETIPLETGCYIGGHHGTYVPLELACLYNSLVTDVVSGSFLARMSDAFQSDDLEYIVDLSDRILDRMNSLCDGGVFYWHDGEIFLNTFQELESEGDEF